MSSIAIITALDRELTPLVRHWQWQTFTYEGQSFRVYQHENVVAVAGGIGARAATAVARAMVAQYNPQWLVSAGVAGGLQRSVKVGTVIVPSVIVDSATGSEYRFAGGNGVLVTASEIVDAASKRALAEKFDALAVDMEAAAVAEVARQENIGFRCLKAVSEGADFVMPPLNRFVGKDGRFRTARFVGWAVVHPSWWPGIAALARNTDLAAKSLCNCLKRISCSRDLEMQA